MHIPISVSNDLEHSYQTIYYNEIPMARYSYLGKFKIETIFGKKILVILRLLPLHTITIDTIYYEHVCKNVKILIRSKLLTAIRIEAAKLQ